MAAPNCLITCLTISQSRVAFKEKIASMSSFHVHTLASHFSLPVEHSIGNFSLLFPWANLPKTSLPCCQESQKPFRLRVSTPREDLCLSCFFPPRFRRFFRKWFLNPTRQLKPFYTCLFLLCGEIFFNVNGNANFIIKLLKHRFFITDTRLSNVADTDMPMRFFRSYCWVM